ncbi:hypothetical protein [Leadbettera azotonutricia]|uniref:PEGA domain-containing protein n=1 Tax=Leadbettera azotonutricia (strain ATCC BAA-888 / DSM 13862 / ZAS-9) TaxID=545695 RepID=F5Y7I8_LEAAZ|nr:hypothetical protein [Leadbettera azotonutricia]AEF81163.1 hypothetical protein TREAZ_1092 [Leadbettera azotonutricia ZAS-9]
MKLRRVLLVCLCLANFKLYAEPLRILNAGIIVISLDNLEGSSLPLTYTSTAAIQLSGDIRFFRGVQLELTAPQRWISYSGSLGVLLYNNLSNLPAQGVADIEARQLHIEAMPGKVQSTWQIPLRQGHGLRASPYIMIPTGVVAPSTFPLLFRLMPVIKGISEEIENMVFRLAAKPILSDEGAVKLVLHYPEQLPKQPVSILIDDKLVENQDEELLLKEGEHSLVLVSEDYRNESRRFVVERAKVLDVQVELQDPTPLILFEYPENARIFLDNVLVRDPQLPHPVEPGFHEVRFQVSDYSIIRPVTVQKGKTYKIALSVDVDITEDD